MPTLAVELSEKTNSQHCDCCGKDQITVWGTVSKKESVHAVYYANMHPEETGQPNRILSLTISMGTWGSDQIPPDRDWIHLKVRSDFQMMVRDAQEAIYFGKEFLGRPM